MTKGQKRNAGYYQAWTVALRQQCVNSVDSVAHKPRMKPLHKGSRYKSLTLGKKEGMLLRS